ncbi:MAG: hypothetical protein JO061_18150 [Acidobacteriaceae bacterium]|nr:hypothetical protein [Acidobacteriaceae bacterium]
MTRLPQSIFVLFLSTGLSVLTLSASQIPIAILSLDPVSGTSATFDISNETGPNASAPDFPATSQVTFETFSLNVNFLGGGTVTEDMSQFTSDGSGGFTGDFSFDLSSFSITSAQLTGALSPLEIQLSDGSFATLASSFDALFSPSSGNTLAAGDSAVIAVAQTPEPDYTLLIAAALSTILIAAGKLRLLGGGK